MAKPRKKGTRKKGTRKKGTRKKGTRKKGTRKKGTRKKGTRKKGTRKRKEKTKKSVFEARRDEEVPEGFVPLASAITPEFAYAVIQARLDDARDVLPEGIEGRVLLHAYADHSIDGELFVKVPEGADTADVAWSLYESFGQLSVGSHYWISMGVRYAAETDDERYRRYKGMLQVQSNYQRAMRTNIAEENLILRHYLIEGMDKKFGEVAHSVFIRLHWNPEDAQPKR